ncbi:MAG: hypothetical protein IKE36_07885, partial [Solobacterium sp.]|nr:hypothetical protein [Solobacterium sp.]
IDLEHGNLPDPVLERFNQLSARVAELEYKLNALQMSQTEKTGGMRNEDQGTAAARTHSRQDRL